MIGVLEFAVANTRRRTRYDRTPYGARSRDRNDLSLPVRQTVFSWGGFA
jgi:hypothetical protein